MKQIFYVNLFILLLAFLCAIWGAYSYTFVIGRGFSFGGLMYVALCFLSAGALGVACGVDNNREEVLNRGEGN